MQNKFVCHSAQQWLAITSQKPIILLATGIQYGKTRLGAYWTKTKMSQNPGKGCNYIIVSPTYKILQQSTLPAFLSVMEGSGKYHKQDAIFELNNGALCFLRTATDPDSIVGITNVYGIWGDEAGLYGLYLWENIQARAAFKNAQILLTTSPYTLNWIYKDLIRPKLKDPKARPDVEYLKAASIDNPYFPRNYYERMRDTMDDRRFRAMFGGNFEKMEGLVYDCFDDEENTITPFPLPQGTKFYAGVDFGYTHPFVIVLLAVTPDGEYYQILERYKTGLPILDTIAIAKQLKQYYPIEMFYCDPSQPAVISEFCRSGIPATAANNDIQLGISLVYELIKTRKFKLFRGDNKYTIDSLNSYHYHTLVEDIDSDTDLKEKNPVKQDDDTADALRYVVAAIFTGAHRKMPDIISQLKTKEKLTIDERIQRVLDPVVNSYEEF